MKQFIKIAKYILLGSIIIVSLILGISVTIPLEATETVEEQSYGSLADTFSCGGDLLLIESVKHINGVWQPIVEGNKDVYCIEPGQVLRFSPNRYTKADIYNFVAITSAPQYVACGCDSHKEHYGKISDTYYVCTGKHYSENSSYYDRKTGTQYENLYDMAFVISHYMDSKLPEETWGAAKQIAIWMSQLSKRDFATYKSGIARERPQAYYSAMTLLEYGSNYKKFYEKILEEDENGNTGMKPKSMIDEDEIKMDIDYDEKLVKVGPFKLAYVEGLVSTRQYTGEYSNYDVDYETKYTQAYAFGGISDMYLIDGEGNRIDIKNIIREGDYRANGKTDIYKIEYNEGYNDTEANNQLTYNTNSFFSKYDRKAGISNLNYIDWFAYEKSAPQPEREFYVEFEWPEELGSLNSLKLHVQFAYLKAEMQICMRDGLQYWVNDYCSHTNYHTHTVTYSCGSEDCDGHSYTYGCDDCMGAHAFVDTNSTSQDGVYVVDASRSFVKEEFEILIPDLYSTTMKVGGYVFDDVKEGKDSQVDGLYTNSDVGLENIQVSLYEVDEETNELKLATLATLKQEKPTAKETEINDEADYTRRTNPTLTDEYGYYEFRGVNPMKKYIVMFTYNGQTYVPTEYLEGASGSTVAQMVKAGQYSSVSTNNIWKQTSKATELNSEREAYDQTFAVIGSTPTNYKIPSTSIKLVSGTYNQTFTSYELAGIKLNSNGQYVYVSDPLIDNYYKIVNGKIIDTLDPNYSRDPEFTEGIISTKIKEYIKNNRKYPTNLKTEIYSKIAGNSSEMWAKLQFIEDCKINAYTKSQNTDEVASFDQYPVYNQFTTSVKSGNEYPNNSYENGTYKQGVTVYENHTLKCNGYAGKQVETGNKNYGTSVQSKGSITYKNIYEGQLQINCGLWQRDKTDIAVQKDVYKATIKINGKVETYQYDKRNADDVWEIQDKIQMGSYYSGNYERALYPSDYAYNGSDSNGSGKLEVYITYKIAIRNQSQNILTEIDQIVDYYDETYTYIPEYSWAMYDEISITQDEYYSIMTDQTEVGSGKFKSASKSGKNDLTGNKFNTSTGGNISKANYTINGYDAIYLNGLNGKKLESGEQAYFYLTFKVNDATRTQKVTIDEVMHNIVEINGYSTYYANNTELPNGITKNSKDVAGSIDLDSTPGNLTNSDVREGEYTFEDDTDRAKGMKIYIDNSLIRTISGVVWEDKRNESVDGTDAVVGNGIRETSEQTINGIKVEMWEVLANGSLQKPANNITSVMETKTINKVNGSYYFEGFIPGDYIIRFTYGGSEVSATANGYNGQDYKSTTYQAGITQTNTQRTDVDNNRTQGYYGYDKENATQNRTNGNSYTMNRAYNYGYDIYKSDSSNTNYSDAKDIWLYRQNVNTYSSDNYSGVQYELANTLNNYKVANDNTVMIAETGVIVVEGEYNRVNSDNDEKSNNGYNGINYANENDDNGTYNILNVDFGLQERPKAGLELNKQVSNVKIVLANQTIQFDTTQSVENLIWKSKTAYNITEMKTETSYDTEGPKSGNSASNVYSDYTRYDDFRNAVMSRVGNLVIGQKGLIQATMDEELMHGATIQITYDITVTNIGEVDYNETTFYYTGKVKDKNTIVKTSADLVIDYVANNLQFRTDSNSSSWDWKTTTEEQINSNKYVSSEVATELKDFNTIIVTGALNEKLIPDSQNATKYNSDKKTSTGIQLILTQSITSQNESDDLNYGNIAEIVKISNDVGRRMAYSVQGNQSPSGDPTEPDSSMAERVIILPPFGEQYLYMGLGVLIVLILGVSILIIKKTVLKKNKF